MGGRHAIPPTLAGSVCFHPIWRKTAPAALLEKKKWRKYLRDQQAGVHLERVCCGCSAHRSGYSLYLSLDWVCMEMWLSPYRMYAEVLAVAKDSVIEMAAGGGSASGGDVRVSRSGLYAEFLADPVV